MVQKKYSEKATSQKKQKERRNKETRVAIGAPAYIYHILSVPASPDQGHDRLCRRGVGRVFLAGVRPDSPSRRRIPSCYRPGPGRGVVVELGQRGAH